jgi:hypothetical protein
LKRSFYLQWEDWQEEIERMWTKHFFEGRGMVVIQLTNALVCIGVTGRVWRVVG